MVIENWPNGECDVFEGNEALRKMEEILSPNGTPNKKCIQLAQEVCDFFGTDLRLGLNKTAPLSAVYPYIAQHSEEVRIMLAANTERAPEALSHELLHGKLFCCGYPLFQDDDGVLEVLNVVHHALIYSMYKELGLDTAKFQDPTQYHWKLNTCKSLPPNAPDGQIAECRSVFGIRLLWDWIDYENTGDVSLLKWKNENNTFIADKYPELFEIHSWLEKGEYKVPVSFAGAFNDLLSIMGKPKIEEWFTLTKGKNKPDRALLDLRE